MSDRKPTMVRRGDSVTEERPYGKIELIGQGGTFLERSSVVRAVFAAGSETRGHFHLTSEELYIAEEGEAEMRLWHHERPEDVSLYTMRRGDCLAIPPTFVHHVRVTSAVNFETIVVASPPFSAADQFFPGVGGREHQ